MYHSEVCRTAGYTEKGLPFFEPKDFVRTCGLSLRDGKFKRVLGLRFFVEGAAAHSCGHFVGCTSLYINHYITLYNRIVLRAHVHSRVR